MLAKKDPYIESAYERLQIISQDKEKRMEYEAREKAIRDYNEGMLEAEERGRERGIAIGEKRGEERGIIQTAKNFIALGLSTDTIAKGTGLSEDQIERLRSEHSRF